jgi:hypothetical protein
MRNVKPIDALPLLFGVIAIASLIVTMLHTINIGLGLLIMLTAATSALVSGMVSIMIAGNAAYF